jgi:hypothetical protein
MERKQGFVLASLGVVILLASLLFVDPSRGHAAAPPGDRDVKVINTPAEPVPVAGAVTVGNGAAAPVLVRDVDRSARQPFSHAGATTFGGGAFAPSMSFNVPAGKILVIETVSMKVELSDGSNVRASFGTVSGGNATEFFLPMTGTPWASFLRFQTTQQVRIHADPGTQVSSIIERNGGFPGGNAWFSVAGYLVDAP